MNQQQVWNKQNSLETYAHKYLLDCLSSRKGITSTTCQIFQSVKFIGLKTRLNSPFYELTTKKEDPMQTPKYFEPLHYIIQPLHCSM